MERHVSGEGDTCIGSPFDVFSYHVERRKVLRLRAISDKGVLAVSLEVVPGTVKRDVMWISPSPASPGTSDCNRRNPISSVYQSDCMCRYSSSHTAFISELTSFSNLSSPKPDCV